MIVADEVRDALLVAIGGFARHRDPIRFAAAVNAAEAEHGQHAARVVRRLEAAQDLLRGVESRPAWWLARRAVAAVAALATLTSDELEDDLHDAVARGDVDRACEHRLHRPGVETDRGVLAALQGPEFVADLRHDLAGVARANGLVAAFRDRVRGATGLHTLDLRELQALLLPEDADDAPRPSPSWPAWVLP